MYDVSVEPEEPLLIEPFIEVITGATGATVLKLYSPSLTMTFSRSEPE
uniref:Uncharacterized protein n=1 Tax=Klebsiella oxytoca TaxID=571 RepID=A0A1Z3ML66_KLEOX|nr:hypothetical protein [Klebsiella oxytoca]